MESVKTMKKTIISLLALFLTMPVYAKKLHYESEYQNAWCSANNGTVEYQLPDLARVDCIMPKYAVEFDFASKWAESIGQSLYYGLMTDRTPAVVLIMENPEREQRYLDRLNAVAEKHGIKVFTMTSLTDTNIEKE